VFRTRGRIRSLAANSFKKVLHQTGLTVHRARKVSFIITFHIVSREESSRFEEVIRFLGKSFEIVPLDQLLARIQNGSGGREPPLVALTFDDGLRSHAEIVYPILKRLDVPATFYVSSDLIDQPGSIWTWEVRSLLKRFNKADLKRFLEASELSDDAQGIVDWMKTIPVDRREQIEREIHECSAGVQLTASEQAQFGLMTWQQIQDLDPNLITVGSHTATHVDLPQAGAERLDRELSRGKEVLESRLNRKIEHFCYPNGSFNQEVLPFVKKYYSSAVTTRPGAVRQGDNLLLLNRVHVDFDLARFSWELAVNASRDDRR